MGRDAKRGAEQKVTANDAAYPELPNAENYTTATKNWYVTWATSPQASRFTPTDWQRLHMLAPLVELYFRDPDKNLMAEIRLNESKLGATPEDRERLRWKIEEAPAEPEKPAASRSRERKDPRAV